MSANYKMVIRTLDPMLDHTLSIKKKSYFKYKDKDSLKVKEWK